MQIVPNSSFFFPRRRLRLTVSLYLLWLPFVLFAADSRPLKSNREDSKKPSNSFEEGWLLLQTAVDKLIHQIEGVDDSVSFTPEEYMSYYTIVYELCTNRQHYENSKLLYDRYKKVFEEYINSTVLPSLRGKKGELLLKELLRRWSNHKIMTSWLSKIFNYLERYDLPRWGLPSLEESSFLSFYDLVYGEMKKQVTDAILSLIDQERAGGQIDQILVNNALGIYKEIGDGQRRNHAKDFAEIMIRHNGEFYYDGASGWIASSSYEDNSPKEDKLHDSPNISSKKINLKSSDGDVFEVDYAVALMSQTIEHIVKTYPDVNVIPLSKVSSKILAKVIAYCKKHTEASHYIGQTLDVDLKDWDASFVEVDQDTLFDFFLSANYLNIKSLLDLATQKIADKMKGKTPEEIRKIFNIKDDFTPEEEVGI